MKPADGASLVRSEPAVLAAVRRRAGSAAASLAVFLLAGWAGATVAQDDALEEIVVTGSRIARPDFASASPIVSITQEAFERTGSTSVDVVMNRLPQFVPDITSTSNNPGNGGQGNIQLRGFGPRATLVLLDGRRLVPANGTGVVDVNIIPSALIESVEIVTGGASAVYGSDAVAGVVNFKLRQKFDGLQLDASGAVTDRGDGEETFVGLTGGLGFANGRGNVFGHVSYSEREAVTYAQRAFSRYALGYVGPGAGGIGPDGAFLPQGSTLVEEASTRALRASPAAFEALFASYGYAAGSVPYQNSVLANADGSLFTLGLRVPGSVVNYRGPRDPLLYSDRLYTYNYAPYNYLKLPLERVSGFLGADFELDGGHELFGQLLYADYSADRALAPAPAATLFMPATNPYIPADLKFLLDSRSNPAADLRYAKRFGELGPRTASNQYDVWQLTAGVRGPLPGDWKYDAYVQYGKNDQQERQAGNALRSKINELVYAVDGGQSTCGEFNLFRLGAISADCARFIAAEGVNRSGYEQSIVEISASGSLFDLPAGELEVAVGAMYKHDEYFYRADPLASVILADGIPDLIGFNASDDIRGSDHNTDVYVEALVPLLDDLPGVRRLEASFGYRHSQYESAGGADAWKAELTYQPLEPLRLRGSLQRAVRAPSVFELYEPRLPVDYPVLPAPFGVLDPCAAGSAERSGPYSTQVEALCVAQGVPAALLPAFEDQDLLLRGVAGGNPDLEPETADTLTAGLVLASWSTAPLFSRMQLSVDWYRIEVEDAIDYVFAYNYVPLCYDARTNPNFDPAGTWCGFFTRDPGTGEIEGLQDVLRNIEGYETSGVDLQFDWGFDAGPGSVEINALVSWMDRFEQVPPRGLPTRDAVGFVGNDGGASNGLGRSLPEWKWNASLSYEWQPVTFGAQWRHIDSMQDADRALDYRIPSSDYFDLFASATIEVGTRGALTLRGGVENLTDEDPPLLPSQVQANTDPSQYDVLGRRYYLNLSYRF